MDYLKINAIVSKKTSLFIIPFYNQKQQSSSFKVINFPFRVGMNEKKAAIMSSTPLQLQ